LSNLGGVVEKPAKPLHLEACGFDINYFIIETVGVGQSETPFSMVDFFLILKISGAGDEL
jgi:LAO/AO transport system kinase